MTWLSRRRARSNAFRVASRSSGGALPATASVFPTLDPDDRVFDLGQERGDGENGLPVDVLNVHRQVVERNQIRALFALLAPGRRQPPPGVRALLPPAVVLHAREQLDLGGGECRRLGVPVGHRLDVAPDGLELAADVGGLRSARLLERLRQMLPFGHGMVRLD